MADISFLLQLESIIESRKADSAQTSYTAALFAEGIYRIAQKVGEEGLETALAAVKGKQEEIASEAADLLYHLLVLLNASGITFSQVIETLAQRHKGR